MDAKSVCLGLLSLREATGYDLRKHVEASGDHFFAMGFGSIYPALATLERQGLIERVDKSNDGGRPRKLYRITLSGRAELKRTLSSVEPSSTLRSELFAFLYFAHLAPPQRVTQILDDRLSQMEATLKSLRETNASGASAPSNAKFVNGLTVVMLEAAARYLRENRKSLESSRAAS